MADPHKIPIDPNGNLTSKTEGTDTWAYTWNAENQLVKVEKNGAEVARYAYDPVGRRVEKVVGGSTTTYAYDGEDILRESRGSGALRYVHGLETDEPLLREDGESRLWFHADGLGSIVKLTDASGGTALARSYDAWGTPESAVDQAGYAFTGREWDPETKLYQYRAREYDPGTGRFLSEDPVGIAGAGNLFSYVAGNPTNWTDPTGMVIRICNRPAEGMPGNHSYLYDTKSGKDCGRGDNSGKECPSRDDTTCTDVPGTEGREDAVMACCESRRKCEFAQTRNFRPLTNDCHSFVQNVLECAGIKNPPGAPGGRFGSTKKKKKK